MHFNTSINLIKVPNRFSHSRPNEDKMPRTLSEILRWKGDNDGQE